MITKASPMATAAGGPVTSHFASSTTDDDAARVPSSRPLTSDHLWSTETAPNNPMTTASTITPTTWTSYTEQNVTGIAVGAVVLVILLAVVASSIYYACMRKKMRTAQLNRAASSTRRSSGKETGREDVRTSVSGVSYIDIDADVPSVQGTSLHKPTTPALGDDYGIVSNGGYERRDREQGRAANEGRVRPVAMTRSFSDPM